MFDLESLFLPSRVPAVVMALANTVAVIAIGDPRRPSLRQWRWLWLFLFLNAVFNVRPFLPNDWNLPFGRLVVSIGRVMYMPPLLLGLAAIIGHAGYRRYARLGALVLTMQLTAALFLGGIIPSGMPILRTTLSYVIILAVAAPAVIARLPRVRGSIFRDPPVVAAIAALLAYGTQLLFPLITASMGQQSSAYLVLLWARNCLWVVCYALWWYAFREARRQARPV